MTVTVDWDERLENLILWKFEGEWRIADFQKALKISDTLVGERQARFDVIVDGRDIVMPKDAFGVLRGELQQKHSLQDLMVIVTNLAARMTLETITKTDRQARLRQEIQFVETLDAAYELVRESRQAAD